MGCKSNMVNQPICPKCESKNIIYQARGNNYLCRRCGERFEKKENK